MYYWPKLPEAAAGAFGLIMNQANIFIFMTMPPVIVYLVAMLFGIFPGGTSIRSGSPMITPRGNIALRQT
jgi:hypothetical protein